MRYCILLFCIILKCIFEMKLHNLLIILLAYLCWNCTNNSNTEKHQNSRNNIVDVQDKIVKIEMEENPVSSFAIPYIMDNFLIISDYKSPDKLIHIFDKNSFKYITSTGDRGEGPQEIANLGRIGINEADRIFYVTDHGKQKIFSFYMDSILVNPDYMPIEKIKLDNTMYPDTYDYINDTLSIGLFSKVLSNSDYTPIVAKWNMETGEVKPMKYLKHPEIERKRVSSAISIENNLYVECYWYHDLMTIGYLNGDFKCNIYGAKWNTKNSSENRHYRDVVFCKDYIVASYLGEKRIIDGKGGGITVMNPTKFLIFDKNGDYIQTLEVGHPILTFCYDKENNRIIMNLDDEMQVSYLDLNL